MNLVRHRANIFAAFCCLLFVLTGSLWIWLPGVQSDEVLFGGGIYGPFGAHNDPVRVFGHDYATMVMTYVGTLKSRIWSPVFRFFGVSAATIRMPALLLGALSVWWFYRLLLRTLGVRAALVGCGLLATDSIYLLTVRWDWGPVALQHLLFIGGMLAIVRWWQERHLIFLSLGFFAFGLAVWDKALFVWTLPGLGVATLAIFPRQLRESLTPRILAVAAAAFLAGAFPVIRYNVRNHGATISSNSTRTFENFSYKSSMLLDTLNGSALFGGLTRDDNDGPVREPARGLERRVAGVSKATGLQRRHGLLALVVTAWLLLPLYWQTPARKAVLFAVVFCAVAWVQMIQFREGGTSPHHTILLWPMPVMIVAAASAAIAERISRPERLIAAVTGTAMVAGLLVTSTYYRQLLRNGGNVVWTDAIYLLVTYLHEQQPRYIALLEWGFFDNLRTFGKGHFPIAWAGDPDKGEAERSLAAEQLAQALFVTHVPEVEIEKGRAERLVKFADEQGFRKTHSRVFHDTNGRAVIETFTFTPSR